MAKFRRAPVTALGAHGAMRLIRLAPTAGVWHRFSRGVVSREWLRAFRAKRALPAVALTGIRATRASRSLAAMGSLFQISRIYSKMFFGTTS